MSEQTPRRIDVWTDIAHRTDQAVCELRAPETPAPETTEPTCVWQVFGHLYKTACGCSFAVCESTCPRCGKSVQWKSESHAAIERDALKAENTRLRAALDNIATTRFADRALIQQYAALARDGREDEFLASPEHQP